jgi:hypothetical protein
MEYKTKKRFKASFSECFVKIFNDRDLAEFYFIGAFAVFLFSFPATFFVFIFDIFEKLLK